ncbi:MAG: hypothetical protein HQL60_01085 [Magnetococcales bacterium]|nr:hypothetical protein [Magnetococcales bacterium]
MNSNWFYRIFLIAILVMWCHDSESATGHRRGCEFPMAGVEVCWELTADERPLMLPLEQIHLLPVVRTIRFNQPEVLVDYTRWIYRQLLAANLTEQLKQEWVPVDHLEGAIEVARRSGWPALLWINPRILRDSSPSSPGLVDWDVYLIEVNRGRGGRGQTDVRTMRVRVTSNPQVKSGAMDNALLAGGALIATGMLRDNLALSAGAVAAAAAVAPNSPPVAGYPLELLTELAVRQVIYLSQFAITELPGEPGPQSGRWWHLLRLVHPEPVTDIPAPPPAAGYPAAPVGLIDRIIGPHP